jgi:ABC-type lipoprotein export system ATPase subunit
MLETKKLKKVYKTKKGVSVEALKGISLKFPEKGMIFLLGKSGSGKSTLLNLLGGLDKYDSGEIIIKGVSSKAFKQNHFDSYRNTYVGFIFQEYNVLEEFSVGANIALAIELQGRKATDNEISKILREVDLDGFGDRKPNELSGGQKQRVAIARALVKNPQIIMADEPTGALDSNTGKQVLDTLKKLSREKLVIIVSHDREFAEMYGDRIIELADGSVISDVEKTHEEGIDFDQGIIFEEDGFIISEGYHLTEEDRISINEYMDHTSKDIKGKFRAVKQSRGKFQETNQESINC